MLSSQASCPEGSLYMWTVGASPRIEEIGFAAAKLMLGANSKGHGGPSFGFGTNLGTHGWGTGCHIHTLGNAQDPVAACEAYTYLPLLTTYRTREVRVSYDKWYMFRIETDPETMEIIYHLDDEVIGSYTPTDDALALRKAEFYSGIDVWSDENSSITGYFDYVQFGPNP